MAVPSNEDILNLLDKLEGSIADDLEFRYLDFKPWNNAKDDMRVAVEYAVCFANAEGGVVVFGVADRIVGRSNAIHGAKGYDLDIWRRGIFDSTRPHLDVKVEELAIPEGTGTLLVMRVPEGSGKPYGTVQGLYKQRVGKNCMPMDAAQFRQSQISTGVVDWSGATARIGLDELDPVEIGRARNILRRFRPQSELVRATDQDLLVGIGAVRKGLVTHTELLLFGNAAVLRSECPQHQVHYVHQVSETKVARNDSWNDGLLSIIDKVELAFAGPANPECEVSVGLFKLRIPAFPIEVVREAVLNAVTHRDYSDPGEVLIRHTHRELVITSPGGFLEGITLQNILRHEPMARNRSLSEAFEKLGLVERAGMGRRRIFIPMLEFGKRIPTYEDGTNRVTLRIFDGTFDERMAILVAKWRSEGKELDLDSLLLLSFLRDHAFIDTSAASCLLQVNRDTARGILDQMAQTKTGILERKGNTKAATFHLNKSVARDLLGRAGYTQLKGIDPIRYREMVREHVIHHGMINAQECRELLGLGESSTAKVDVSRLLAEWSGEDGFLKKVGTRGRGVHYLPRETGEVAGE